MSRQEVAETWESCDESAGGRRSRTVADDGPLYVRRDRGGMLTFGRNSPTIALIAPRADTGLRVHAT